MHAWCLYVYVNAICYHFLKHFYSDSMYRIIYVSRDAKETVSSRDRDLDVMRRKLSDSEDELNAVLKRKDAALRDYAHLRDELDRVRLDNKVREDVHVAFLGRLSTVPRL